MAAPGVTVRPLRNLTGTSEFCEVFLDEAPVAPDALVGDLGGGWAVATHALGCERSTFLAQRALPLGREFENLLGAVATTHPQAVTGTDFIDAFVRTRALNSLVRRVQATVAGGEVLGSIGPMGKLFWSEAHQAQLGLLTDAAGFELTLGEGPFGAWQRALLHSRAETIYGGTSEIQRNLIGKALGLPSDRGR